MNVGKAIKHLRKERTPQLNQSEFAKLIGITQTYLSQIETGSKKPSIKLFETISDQFKIPIPIIIWLSITDDDISKDKIEYYRFIKPQLDSLISELY